ncbi:MAG: hypothetical protein P1P86_16175 [Bacteroidales bacterium]|nr:hypothetical protein [Bacteroidales bacterium]
MKAIVKLFLVLVTLTVAVFGWITGQYRDRDFLILVLVLTSLTLSTFLILNILDYRLQARKRKEKESRSRELPGEEAKKIKRAEGSFALREKKSGLSWGGGNIKASEATRGSRRKFLGR